MIYQLSADSICAISFVHYPLFSYFFISLHMQVFLIQLQFVMAHYLIQAQIYAVFLSIPHAVYYYISLFHYPCH